MRAVRWNFARASFAGSVLARFGSPALYALLSLLSFPALEAVFGGEHAPAYVLDIFDDGGGVPRLAMAVNEWSRYGFSLWNPSLTAGNAFLAQTAVPPIAPDVLLAFLFGPFAAYATVSWLMPFLAGVSMHLFLRDSLHLSRMAILAGSIVFLFSYVHFEYGASVAVVPLMLWAGDRAAKAEPRRWLVLGIWVSGAALMIYQGLSQVALIVAGLQLVWAMLTAERGTRRVRLATLAVVWALAFGLYAPVLMSQLVSLPLSQRTAWDLGALAPQTPFEALAAILRQYASLFVDVPTGTGIGMVQPRYGTWFVGAAGLVLVGIGALAGRHDRRRAVLTALLLVVPVLDLLATLLIPYQPSFGLLGSFQFIRVRHVMPFLLAAVAAVGVDAVITGALAPRPEGASDRVLSGRMRAAVRRVIGPVAVLAVLAVAGWQLSIAVRHAVFLNRRDTDLQTLGWTLTAAALALGIGIVIAGVVVLSLRGSGRPKAGTRMVLVALLIVLVGERALWAHASQLISPGIGTYADSLDVTPGQAFLLAQPGIAADRILTFGDQPNRMAYAGLLQADGYQAVYPLAYHDLFGALIAPELATDPEHYAYFWDWGSRAMTFGPAVDQDLVRLLGVRWLYVRGPDVPTVDGIVPRFQSGDVTVYEVPDVLPRAFVVGAVSVASDRASVLRAMARASLDDLRTRAFATSKEAAAMGVAAAAGSQVGAAPAGGLRGTPGADGGASISSDTPDRVVVQVAATGPGVLVLTDVEAPGWVATVDGHEQAIGTVDGALRGVAVDATTHQVVFSYEPLSTRLGFGLAALAGGVTLVWLAALRRRDRARARGYSAPHADTDGPDRDVGVGERPVLV